MSGALHDLQAGGCGDLFPGGFDFFNGSEIVCGAVYKKRGYAQGREMFHAEFLGPSGRMQRVREQQQRFRNRRIFGGQHARLAASVGMSGQVDHGGELA